MAIVVKSTKGGNGKDTILPGIPFASLKDTSCENNVDPDLDLDIDDASDDLSSMLFNQPESPKVLDHILRELATEVRQLKRQRNTAASPTQISARRVDALKKIGDIWLKRTELTKKSTLDIKSPEFQAVLKSLLDKIKITMVDSGFNAEMVQVFFSKLSQSLVTWEEELGHLMQTKDKESPPTEET